MMLRNFRKRAKAQFSAIRYDGTPKQAADIVTLDDCFVRKFGKHGLEIVVYYSYREPARLTKGDWLIKSRFGTWLVIPDALFLELFEEIA